MKHRELFIKQIMTWLAIGTGLLAGALILSGIAVRGPAGLNLFAWGLALAPLAVGVIILRIVIPLLARKVSAFKQLMPKTIQTDGNETRPLHFSNNAKPRNMAMSSVLAVVSNVEEQEEIGDTEETDYLNPPRDSAEANFNWDTGEYDVARGIGGMYDPPYDLMKG